MFINNPDHILTSQRQPRTVSFWQIKARATEVLGALNTSIDTKLKAEISEHQDEDKVQGQGLLSESLNAIYRVIAPELGFKRRFTQLTRQLRKVELFSQKTCYVKKCRSMAVGEA